MSMNRRVASIKRMFHRDKVRLRFCKNDICVKYIAWLVPVVKKSRFNSHVNPPESYLYVSAIVAIGCGIDEYIELKPELMGLRDEGAGGLTATCSTARRWLRSFSSRRHFARRLLNHTCTNTTKRQINTTLSAILRMFILVYVHVWVSWGCPRYGVFVQPLVMQQQISVKGWRVIFQIARWQVNNLPRLKRYTVEYVIHSVRWQERLKGGEGAFFPIVHLFRFLSSLRNVYFTIVTCVFSAENRSGNR